jgi:hypothetical protein
MLFWHSIINYNRYLFQHDYHSDVSHYKRSLAPFLNKNFLQQFKIATCHFIPENSLQRGQEIPSTELATDFSGGPPT